MIVRVDDLDLMVFYCVFLRFLMIVHYYFAGIRLLGGFVWLVGLLFEVFLVDVFVCLDSRLLRFDVLVLFGLLGLVLVLILGLFIFSCW